MNLPRIFATAVARRVAFLVVAALAGWMFSSKASACTPTGERSWGNCADAGRAASIVSGAMWSAIANCNVRNARFVDDKQGRNVVKFVTYGGDGVTATCGYMYPQETGVGVAGYIASCSSRDVLSNASYQGASYCQQGCSYVPDDVAPLNPNSIDFSFFNQDRIIKHAKRLRPTGDICQSLPNSPDDGTKSDVCVTQGTLTQCVTPDGKHCASGASGKRYCWEPGEHGTKTSGNEAMTKSPQDKPVNLPPVPPKNGGEWEKKGEGTVSTTINNNTDNSKVTNNVSNYGDKGSGAAGGGADGESNGGSGDGSGKGDGEGEGGKGDFGSVGGGTCEGGFTCTGGDPVLCAIAQQQYQARCEAEGRFGDGAGAGDFPGGGEGNSDPDPKDYNKTVKVGLSMIDTGGLGMPTQCPTFEAIQTSFGDFSVDAESWCQILGVARSCLLFLGAFMSLGILMGWGGKD